MAFEFNPEELGKKAGEIAEQAKKMAEEGAAAAKPYVEEAGKKAGEFAEQAKPVVAQAAAQAGEYAKQAAEQAKPMAEQAAKQAGDLINQAKGQIEKKAGKDIDGDGVVGETTDAPADEQQGEKQE